MTTSEVAGPPHERGGRGLINLTNKNRVFKYEEHEHTGRSLFGLKILYVVFLSVKLGKEAAGNVAAADCISPADS